MDKLRMTNKKLIEKVKKFIKLKASEECPNIACSDWTLKTVEWGDGDFRVNYINLTNEVCHDFEYQKKEDKVNLTVYKLKIKKNKEEIHELKKTAIFYE